MGILKKTKVAKTVESMDLLLKNFAGEQVEIVLDKDLEHPMTSDGESIEVIKMPLTVTGYLTDIDDQFVYLGLSINQINQAVNKDFIIHIGIMDEDSLELDEEGAIAKGKFN